MDALPTKISALRSQVHLVSTELSTLLFHVMHGGVTPDERAALHQRIDLLEAEFVELMDMLRTCVTESPVEAVP